MTPFHPILSLYPVIADAVKTTLGEQIKALVENEVAKAVQPLVAKMNHLEEENRSLFQKSQKTQAAYGNQFSGY